MITLATDGLLLRRVQTCSTSGNGRPIPSIASPVALKKSSLTMAYVRLFAGRTPSQGHASATHPRPERPTHEQRRRALAQRSGFQRVGHLGRR
jgi:hypothetical protein